MKYPVTIFYSEEGGGYIAIAPDLKGCAAFGETPLEALRELETAMGLWPSVRPAGFSSHTGTDANERITSSRG